MAKLSELQVLGLFFFLAIGTCFSCDTATNSRKLLDELFNKRNLSAADVYLSEPYYQHNPGSANGIQTLKNFVTFLTSSFPAGADIAKIHRTGGDRRFGFVHSETIDGLAIVDIYRFNQDCKIVEHWDIIQNISQNTASGNDMFSCLSCETSTEPPPFSCDTLGVAKILIDKVVNRNFSGFENYFQPPYYQHNPRLQNGIENAIASFKSTSVPDQGPSLVLRHSGRSGNYVFLHSHSFIPGLTGSILDIFRFNSACKIVEHWDVFQSIPTNTVSGNDLFSCLSCEDEAATLPFSSPTPATELKPSGNDCAPVKSDPAQIRADNVINVNFAGLLNS